MEHLAIAETMTSLDATLDFEWGSTDIANKSYAVLDGFSNLLTKHPSLQVNFEGHCGIEAPNHIAVPFSTERAESVRYYLMQKGIEASRLRAVGLGKSRCLCERPGGSAAGADKNRRVEIYLVSNGVEFPERKDLEEGKCKSKHISGYTANPHYHRENSVQLFTAVMGSWSR